MPKCSKTENENNIDLKSIYHKIYPKDDFQKSLATIKKCLKLVITRVGESNLYSFLSDNGQGVKDKLSGNQEGGITMRTDTTLYISQRCSMKPTAKCYGFFFFLHVDAKCIQV